MLKTLFHDCPRSCSGLREMGSIAWKLRAASFVVDRSVDRVHYGYRIIRSADVVPGDVKRLFCRLVVTND